MKVKKTMGTIIGVAIAGYGLFKILGDQESQKYSNKWFESVSDDELADDYEERRLDWLKNGGGDITPEMKRINNEMARRSNEKYEKEYPNVEPRHREHGWYLSNDD